VTIEEGVETMTGYRDLTVICGALALVLGLAGCGGGGGSKTPDMPAAGPDMQASRSDTTASGSETTAPTEQDAMGSTVALAAAIEAAKITGADGTFDDAPHGVVPAVTAAHDGTNVTIGVTETGTPRGGTRRGGEFVAREEGPAAIAGWTGARFRRGEATEHLVVYTNVDPAEPMAFVPENLNKLNEVSGLTGETVPESGLAIEAAWFPLIASTSLAAATPRGSVTYGPVGTDTEQGLAFTGTFGGGTGEFRCSGDTCSVTLDDRGMATTMGGDWTFAPADDAMVHVPDYDHLYFGWWLNENEDGSYGFQTLADGAGFPGGAANVRADMTGSATYQGAAAGVYATMDVSAGRVTAAASGEFTARAALTAHFFGTQDAGEVTGTIDSFRNGDGAPMEGWGVTLKAAALRTGAASFAGETGGTIGLATSEEGSWEGRFHGTDGADARPGHVTGRFDLHFPGAHLAGAFGASK